MREKRGVGIEPCAGSARPVSGRGCIADHAIGNGAAGRIDRHVCAKRLLLRVTVSSLDDDVCHAGARVIEVKHFHVGRAALVRVPEDDVFWIAGGAANENRIRDGNALAHQIGTLRDMDRSVANCLRKCVDRSLHRELRGAVQIAAVRVVAGCCHILH